MTCCPRSASAFSLKVFATGFNKTLLHYQHCSNIHTALY
jgi:hypothetical protein